LALVCILQTGKLGGELVYGHAGGVGIRSGDPEDVARLFLAGLFRQAELDERAGRTGDAASLLELAAQRFPDDPAVQVRAAEVRLEDRKDPAGALAVLERLAPTSDDPRLRFRRGWLTADALDALGRRPEARAVLERLRRVSGEHAPAKPAGPRRCGPSHHQPSIGGEPWDFTGPSSSSSHSSRYSSSGRSGFPRWEVRRGVR